MKENSNRYICSIIIYNSLKYEKKNINDKH